MKSWIKTLAVIAVLVVAAGATLVGCNVGQYEEPAYTATAQEGAIEQRAYAPVIAAEVTVAGERREAISAGFRLIADYIFGNNQPNQKIAMTAPVIQQPSEKIAMTAPVIQQAEGDKWVVQFIMPSQYTLETLPKPNNPQVKLKPLAARDMVVIRFAGSSKDEALIAEKIAELEAYVAAHGLKTRGAPVLAFYDPPWTLPPLRRNEVMLAIAPSAKRKAAK